MPVKPSDNEEDYIRQEELEKLRRQRLAMLEKTAEEEVERLKKLHWMRCPKCGMELDEVDYKAVKVDACLSCGGMFLDRGEIEKVLEHERSEKNKGALTRLLTDVFRSSKY